MFKYVNFLLCDHGYKYSHRCLLLVASWIVPEGIIFLLESVHNQDCTKAGGSFEKSVLRQWDGWSRIFQPIRVEIFRRCEDDFLE